MLFALATLLADGEPAAKPAQPGDSLLSTITLFLPIFVLFYFLMIRPMRKQQQEQMRLLSSLKKNDRVIVAPGIYGTVVEVKTDVDEVVVKVDDNVRLRVTKGTIQRNLTNEEAAASQQQQAAATSADNKDNK